MKRLFAGLTVLLLHTAAAYGQQSGPAEAAPADTLEVPQAVPPAPPPAAEPAPPPAPARPPQYQQYPQPQQLPPGYGPPPGYAPPPGYVAPPAYGPPPVYVVPGHGPRRFRPRYYYYYPPAPPPPPPPPRSVIDRPFTIGGGGGFGGLQFKDSAGNVQTTSAGAFTFRIGLGLRPGLILMWDMEGAIADNNVTTYRQTANLAALQLFLTNRLFLKGGLGVAQVNQRSNAFSGSSDLAAAAMGGIGYELIQGWHWSFDIEATITGARYTNPDETWTNWSLVNLAINFF
jgi:hypothetical protein